MDMSDAVIMKSSRLKSVVWNDFDRIKKGDICMAVCRHCKKRLSGSSTSGTSHLRNHLVRCQRRTGNNNNNTNNGIAQLYSARDKKKDIVPLNSNYGLDHDQKKDEVLSLVNFRFEQDTMMAKDDGYGGGFDQRRSRFDLARMIILHGYSLGMVDDVGFRVFVKNLQPLFELVDCDRVELDILEIYAREKQKVSEVLDKLPGKISLSANKWASLEYNAEYLCLTGHYIDESWELRKTILNFIVIDPSHTEDVHAELIMTCLMDWDIDRKLFSMTFDSCSSNDNVAVRISDRLSQNRFLYSNGRLFDVRCAVSLVSSMVREVLAAVNDIADNIRESVRYVKSSQTVQTKFNEIVQESGLQPLKCLSLANPLRWDSAFAMLEAALEHREAFSVLQERDPGYKNFPSDEEWDRANLVAGFLKFFVEITNGFAKNKSPPTSNLYFPDLCDMYLQLNEWCKNPDDYVSSLAERMRTKFEEYWDRCGLGLAVAAMLDPRFKMKLVEYYYSQIYGTGAPGRIDDVFESVKALYNEHSMCLASLDQGMMAWQESNGVGSSSSGRNSRDRLMGFDKFLHETSQSDGSKSDLDKYLEEPLFPRNTEFNILNWWKVHTPRYPILSMMARNVLGIPMSKVGPDLVFSSGGRVLDRSWGSLSPATLQALVCSQDWIRSELES